MLSKIMEYMFEGLVITTVFLMLLQLQAIICVDELRNHPNTLLFRARRWSLGLIMITLCVTAAYGYGWEPWPPLIALIAALDLSIITHIMVLRIDQKRLERLHSITRTPSLRRG